MSAPPPLPGSFTRGLSGPILSQRWVTLMSHEPRRLVERVSYMTSPGHGDGSPGWRRRNGLLGGGPAPIVRLWRCCAFPQVAARHTWRRSTPESSSSRYSPQPAGGCEWVDSCTIIEPPSSVELTEIRRLDPDGFWTRRSE